MTDFVKEIHDTHHPVGIGLYYEDQKPEAKRFTENFLNERAPKYLGYFENVLKKSGGPLLLGRKITYVDLSMFQLIEGLRYAFPKAMKASSARCRASSACTTASRRGRVSRPISPRRAASPSTRAAFSGIIRNWIG